MPKRLVDTKDIVIRKGGVFESWSPNDQLYMLITSEPELTVNNETKKFYGFDCLIYIAKNTEYSHEIRVFKEHFNGSIQRYEYYIEPEEANGLILELDRLKKLYDLMLSAYNKAYDKLTQENYRIHDSK